MDNAIESSLRNQLIDRRGRLERSIAEVGEEEDLVRLLREVDSALKRMDTGSFGRCEVCSETVDEDFLSVNPLIQYCLCALTDQQQRALERDLGLAARIQWALLPPQNLSFGGWEVHYRYEPSGAVSGDYCDAVAQEGKHDGLFFLVGDVSGKGVAASFLMARLNALFRSLIEVGLPPGDLVERANRHFSESTVSSHYATLVCGRADRGGAIEVCNAGHSPPLVSRDGEVVPVDSTGFPVGMFGASPYRTHKVDLAPGDTLLVYTDGLTEANDPAGNEYGIQRLARLLHDNRALSPASLASACLSDQAEFRSGAPRNDDLTLMVIRRSGA